jgi:serine/threonine protein kinase
MSLTHGSETYTFIRQLGAGSFGEVQLATTSTGKQVAIKKMNLTTPKQNQSFTNEYNILTKVLGQCQSKRILCVVDFFIDTRVTPAVGYIIMEYIPNTLPMNDAIASGRKWTKTQLFKLMSYLVDAVSYLHEKGIIHMDIKPANILIDASGMPILIDFGLACENKKCAFGGTIGYLAPELFSRDKTRISNKIDVYSLGIVFFYLLCGRVPFTEVDLLAHFKNPESTQYPTLNADDYKWLHNDFDFVLKMIERDPKRRPNIFIVKDIVNSELISAGIIDVGEWAVVEPHI